MKAIIIAIGDELLNGQTVNTNAAWLGQELNDIGVDVTQALTISDNHDEIKAAIDYATKSSTLVLLTGGLGPTKDDVTKLAIADFFQDEMVFSDATFAHINKLFEMLGRTPTELHKDQCYMPSSAILLTNNRGTAPGMWIHKGGVTLLSMPGVPSEMKGIMTDHGLDKIQALNEGAVIIHHIIRTAGQGETHLAGLIEEIVDDFPEELSIAYLPGLASVKLRITARGTDRSRLEKQLAQYTTSIEEKVAPWTYNIGNKELQEVIGDRCREKSITIGTAESCTGGHIAHLLTQVPGSSAYYEGSIISYSNRVKSERLGVSEETLGLHGAVSEETVREMVQGGITALGVDVCVAVSGVAGPGGGTDEKPVGTVWIAVGDKDRVVARKWQLAKDRSLNIRYTSVIALNQLRLFIDGRL